METAECVIGAGLAGLTLAHALVERGGDPLVLDKGRTPGGRMATRRFEGGLFDHGLPVLEDGPLTRELAVLGTTAGLLEEAELPGGTGWYSPLGLSALGKHLAEVLRSEMRSRVGTARREGDSVVLPVEVDGGDPYELEVTGTLFVTAPLPQAREIVGDLVGPSLTGLPNPYSRCLVGLAVPEAGVELPGGPLVRELEDPDFERLVLEFRKFPDREPGLSLRATPEASERLFEAAEGDQEAFFRQGLSDLGIEMGEPGHLQVKKWGYSQPVEGLEQSHLLTGIGGVRLVVAGDAFASGSGPAVERALVSAHAALDASSG